MNFDYKRYRHDIIRPVIPVEIQSGMTIVTYEVLIDSGADDCIFDSQIADILGLNITDGIKRSVFGITGQEEDYYIHKITLRVGGHPYNIMAGFKKMPDFMRYGIVGQRGFFENFIVKFDYQKERIEVFPCSTTT